MNESVKQSMSVFPALISWYPGPASWSQSPPDYALLFLLESRHYLTARTCQWIFQIPTNQMIPIIHWTNFWFLYLFINVISFFKLLPTVLCMARCGKSAMIFRRNRKIANCNEFRLGIQPQWAIHVVVQRFLFHYFSD